MTGLTSRFARYDASEKGRARKARYDASEKGRARAKRYRDSEKGCAVRAQVAAVGDRAAKTVRAIGAPRKRRVLSEQEKTYILRRFAKGDTLGLIAFAVGCEKRLVSKTLREAGQDIEARLREQHVAWAWRGKK